MTDPTPALPPMDPDFDDALVAYRDAELVARFGDAAERRHHPSPGTAALALWAAVVAYGDRRAEQARAELIERMEDPLDPLCLRCYLAECKSAQSSPAPEGVDE